MTMISRRSFLKGTGVVAAAAALTACGGAAASTASSAVASSAASGEGADLAQFDDAVAAIGDWAGTYDALIDQIYVEADLAKRVSLMHQAEDILMSTWCIMPIYFYVNLYLMKPEVTNVYNNVFGMKRFMYAQNTKNSNAELNICLASEPQYVDPALTNTVDGGCMMCNLFYGLMTNDVEGNTVYACAEKYEVSADGFTYTFTLKDGLKWSDGADLNANDFVYSWNRAAADTTGSDYSYLFNVIKKKDDGTLDATASADGKTLTVVLGAVCPYFLDLCAFPTLFPVPQKYVDAANKDGATPNAWAMEAGYVTNGAYTMTKWEHSSSIVMEANKNFVDAANVTIPKLNFMLSDDATAIYTAYTNGDLDISSEVPTEEIPNLKASGTTDLHIDPYLGTYYVIANVNSKLFASMEGQQACALRKALTLQIDRDYIVENIAQGGQKPASCFVSDGCADGNGGIFRTNTADYTYPSKDALGYFDPEADNSAEISSLLTAAGFTVGADGALDASTPFSFTYLVNTSSGNVAIAEALQQDYAALGIEMSITQEEWAVFTEDRQNGNYDIARHGWIMDFNDPINELEMWRSDSGNDDAQLGK